MSVSNELFRVAALISWFEVIDDNELRDKIQNEIWCLQNNIATDDLEDITTASVPTSEIISTVLDVTTRPRDEQFAFILCTLKEIS